MYLEHGDWDGALQKSRRRGREHIRGPEKPCEGVRTLFWWETSEGCVRSHPWFTFWKVHLSSLDDESKWSKTWKQGDPPGGRKSRNLGVHV